MSNEGQQQQGYYESSIKPGLVPYTYNPSTQEAEAAKSKASFAYIVSCRPAWALKILS